ncbi:Telomere repeat-binding protein 3 [Cardamine amara subsp. amara]|uniref:Telomere repeat-binding protein 3 n=1 Tax=Cardamine amara subsp. amara TaxID=228776 RepID=A0ABD1AAN1_CARAN
MGTVVGTVDDCREMFEGSSQTRITPFSSTNQIENPVAYKLVRVAGDGRLVPATDEEILEVNETDMHIASDACQTLQPYTDQVKSPLEYNEEMLQKVEQEERLDNVHGSQIPSTPPDTNIQCSNENILFEEDQVHHEALLQEPVPCNINQSNKIEPCSNAEDSPEETALSPAAQKPDFSRVRGEICLDNLPIKALQETFRATFGRETTVKDKTWLKRRIAMGLINSCDVPTTNLTIKDNKLVGKQEKSNDLTDVVSKDMGDEGGATNSKDAPSSTGHVNGHSNASGHGLSSHHYCPSEDYSSEQRAAKRVRKPTRRYIEELSETDEKQQNDKTMIPSKDPRLSEKSEVRSISVSSGKRVTVTRMVSLAGSEIEVPYVSHVRRSRPRENIMALMECHNSCLEDKASAGESNLNLRLSPSQLNSEVVNQDPMVKSASRPVQKEFATSHKNHEEHILSEVDQDMEPEHIDSSGNSSDENNNNDMPIIQGGALRRKHHRAWTLSEVTKLVDGVSKYGAGKWSEIKKLSFSSQSYRTSVDLKDKWRNLLKASFAQSPSNSMGSLKKHGSMHIPMQILVRVRELAEKQALVPPVSKATGDSNRKEKETRSDFL